MKFLFLSILTSALLSTVMIIAVLFIRKIFSKKLDIKIISFLWLMIIIRLAVPVTFESSIHIGEIMPPFSLSTNSEYENAPDQSPSGSVNEVNLAESTLNAPASYEENHTNAADYNFENALFIKISELINKMDIVLYLSIIWAAGAAIAFATKAFRLIKFNKKILSGTPILNTEIVNIINESKTLIKIKRNIPVYECEYIDAPVTYGVFYPKILLPVGFTNSLPHDKQILIILHELYHIKNLDVAKNYLWLASRIIYWFNPILPYAYKKYTEDTELGCDASVLNTFKDDISRLYSQSLIDVIKLSNGEIKLPIALSFCTDKSNLRKRVENMIQPTKKHKYAAVAALLAAIIITVACFTTACLPAINPSTTGILDTTELNEIEFETQPTENTKIIVDITVEVPSNSEFTIVRVAPQNISNKQLENFVDFVFDPEYIVYDGNIKTTSANATYHESTSLISEITGDTYTEITSYTQDGKETFLELTQTLSGTGTQMAYWRFDDGFNWDSLRIYDSTDIENMNNSFDECLETAEKLVQELDGKNTNFRLGDTLCYESETGLSAYRFFFYREYNGILANMTPLLWGEENRYGYCDQINVFVDDIGILEFWWINNTSQIEIIENNAELYDFDEIISTFENYCRNDFTWKGVISDNIKYDESYEITINTAELKIMLIPENDDQTSYMAVPVWEFIGDIVFGEPIYDENSNIITGQQNACIVHINALDGTVVP